MTAVLAPDAATAHPRDAPVWRRVACATPAWLPAIMVAIGGWSHRWMDEDAFINFRIVDQIFAGHGPVFNAGQRIEASTSALWLVVLVAGRAVFGAFVSMEWIALFAGLAAAVGAFVIGGHAARMQQRGAEGVVVPVGLLLVAAVAVVWDFSTSGLEMGLVWLWLACSWWALMTAARSPAVTRRTRVACCVALGLAPLVRPELTLMMLCLLVAWFVLVRPRRIVFDLVTIFAVPVAYEIFRMGYYASIVPNTALAKDAGGLHLSQGWTYLDDFVSPYRLWVTAVLVLATIAFSHFVRPDRRIAIATAAMLTAVLVDVAYIVVIGGDYMHGRLLLPAFFALGLPASVAVKPGSLVNKRNTATLAGLAVTAAVWALISVVWFRPPPPGPPTGLGPAPISDWRTASGATMHPVDVALGLNGTQAAAAYRRGVRGYFKITDKEPRPVRDPDLLVLTLGSIGVPAYDAGTHVFVIDIGGLAEPLAARTTPVPGRQAGHRKQIDDAWYDAIFGGPSNNPKVVAARHALTCDPGKSLMQSVNGRMTAGRFLSNLVHAVSYTRLHVPDDPRVAERDWC
ncbi:MAG: arabinofuranosyltransferase [Actinomycetota bacterium]|nr:arabinofuranosyltransferase [Actinomycetota bacterium]